MDAEIEAQLANGTWELGIPPTGARVLPCRWVYKVKTNPDGSVERFKARLVAKGFAQREGVDFGELWIFWGAVDFGEPPPPGVLRFEPCLLLPRLGDCRSTSLTLQRCF
ncbi:hypothetical protein Vretifemale_130 [Volvox reticuliferus]|uniref:Reverse transcriptase Ty1/copia-type domain-containing protein n=1 Tax=Volvox reticuliferus TaxID=1737510 RepID=A0A8J4BTI0_9CHLO|nr:hypothetical protein Vretifemale_130 [Volvox reticuliferus]